LQMTFLWRTTNAKRFAEIFCEAFLILINSLLSYQGLISIFLKRDILIHKQWGLGLMLIFSTIYIVTVFKMERYCNELIRNLFSRWFVFIIKDTVPLNR
jgi:cellulose synthase/poly-beta-1,6-N-acetylglucosamine synthase-like glycosyltransferase